MQNVELKCVLTGVRSGGCVQPYLVGFAGELISAGYTVFTVRDFMRSAVHLGRWMDSRNIKIGGLTHLLRHSAATAMLRSGASLELVAAVLRHKSPNMTAHYAKIHVELLRQIAQPWPEESSC